MTVLNKGDGSDGNATVTSNTNINMSSLVGRTYADMVGYSLTSLTDTGCTTSETPNGIASGDQILLISLQGPNDITQIDNVGNWEILTVDSVNGSSIDFVTAKTKSYGNNGGDTNIGSAAGNCKVMIQRVPQYNNLTINGGVTLSPSPWNSVRYGVLCIMVKNTLTVNGAISANGSGFKGGGASYSSARWWWGGSYGRGPIYNTYNLGGGSGNANQAAGGGGAYGTTGGGGATTYGVANLSKVYLGSGGGGTYQSYAERGGGIGAGAIMIFCGTLHSYGTISSNGANGLTPAGGGSGGSVLIQAGYLDLHSSNLNANPAYNAGYGRIAVYYNFLEGGVSSTPTAYTDDGLVLGYAFTGQLSRPSVIRVYDTSSFSLIGTYSGTLGSYQINVPALQRYDLIAKSSDDGEIVGYGDVMPIELS